MNKRIVSLLVVCVPLLATAQGTGKYIIRGARKAVRPISVEGIKYVPPAPISPTISTQVNRAATQAVMRATPTTPPVSAAVRTSVPTAKRRSHYLSVGLPLANWLPDDAPRRHPIHRRYPSGLLQEDVLIQDWLVYFKNGFFQPRDQVEAIEGMNPVKMNNIIEYLYYMPLEQAKEIILNPLLETGRLPDFMYDDKLIPGTQRLPAQYYKNKFNTNIDNFVKLAEKDGSIYTDNVQLKELMSTMKDYTFKQGFSYANSPELTAGLRKNWEALYAEISKPEISHTNRDLVNQLWTQPVILSDGREVSLRDYFTQRRKTAFFDQAVPEFYLNSPKWVALENERRNLIAKEYPFAPADVSVFNRMQERWVLGDPDKYFTLEQFAQLITAPYKDAYGAIRTEQLNQGAVSIEDNPVLGLKAQQPTSTTITVNNFDRVGGVCQMAFTDGGYMGRLPAGYDGTSTVNRFEPVVFDNVRVVTFDVNTLEPRIVTLSKVSYVKDLKTPDIDRVRASSMVGDGLDASRDVLTVDQAEKALRDIPHLRATVHPQSRVANADEVPYMKGGGLAAYLALFTPDFYPIKTVNLLQHVDGKWQWVPTHFIRKEVLTHAGFIHRDHLTFTEQVADRIVSPEE